MNLYRDTGLVATFNVPPNQGGTLWTVFELDVDQITSVNDMSYESSSGAVLRRIADTDAHLMRRLPAKD